MKTFMIQIIFLVILISAAFAVSTNPQILNNLLNSLSIKNEKPSPVINKMMVGSTQVSVEVADTAQKRSKGLSEVSFLAEDSGMLFVFPKADRYKFWMKQMRFPLDMVWINGDSVVDLLENVPPPTLGTPDDQLKIYSPISEIDKVLEVNGGFVNLHGVKIGDKVSLEHD